MEPVEVAKDNIASTEKGDILDRETEGEMFDVDICLLPLDSLMVLVSDLFSILLSTRI